MMTRMTGALALLAATALTACGSSSGGDVTSGNSGQDLSYDQLVDRGQSIVDEYADATITENLPASGSARYDGVAGFDVDPANLDIEGDFTPELASQMTLRADFSDATIDGRFYDFESRDGFDVDGELAIAGGEIQSADSQFVATYDGSLVVEGSVVTFDDSLLLGNFGGPNAEVVAGIGAANVAVDGRGLGGPYLTVFAAER